jgi:hypothetical protein
MLQYPYPRSRLQIFAVRPNNAFREYDIAIWTSLPNALDDGKSLASFDIKLVTRDAARSDALGMFCHDAPHGVVDFLGEQRRGIPRLWYHEFRRALNKVIEREKAAAGIHGRRQVYSSEGHERSRSCLRRHLLCREVTVAKD